MNTNDFKSLYPQEHIKWLAFTERANSNKKICIGDDVVDYASSTAEVTPTFTN